MPNSTIKARTDKVSHHLVRGKSESEIAKILKTRRNTIVRDVNYLKRSAQDWLDELAKDGFIFEYWLALEKIKDYERRLQDLFTESEDVGEKIQIMQILHENCKVQLELLGETPTVYAYKRAISKMKEKQNVHAT
jgi:hypothetical protein